MTAAQHISSPRKKLIEVALPLDDINKAAAKEKSIRHGHPSTLHLWWARRPLAACRAVLFASLVDDPSSYLDETEAEAERERLFGIIRRLVPWENSNNETVLAEARTEIRRCVGDNPPPVLDPFCGGGSIPLEAQRLGLEAHASDFNPVAVLITKALIEIPPRFANQPPVNPADRVKIGGEHNWPRATGLATDVRYYGKWMRDEAEKRIGHFYPKAELPKETGGGEATVIAWLWARTVTCPNPACGSDAPLSNSFWLSTRSERPAWLLPIAHSGSNKVRFEVRGGSGEPPDGTVNRKGGICIKCGSAIPLAAIRKQGSSGQLGAQLMAIVAEGRHGRVYLSPDEEHCIVAESASPDWRPEAEIAYNPRDLKTPIYGMTTFGDLFTDRQMVALATLSDLVGETREQVRSDAVAAGLTDDGMQFAKGGRGASAYSDAIATYLAFLVNRMAPLSSNISSWHSTRETMQQVFGRQAIPMIWNFAEVNPFSNSTGNLGGGIDWIAKVLAELPVQAGASVIQMDAAGNGDLPNQVLVSTDPPYYDNIGYADLSDFFYVWLRRVLINVWPELFRTMLVPKNEELVATPYRFKGGRSEAEQFFESGLRRTFRRVAEVQDPSYPMTIFYAFKEAETESHGDGSDNTASRGWESMLEGLITSGFQITGTWPLRTEMTARATGRRNNALASSIVLACRVRQIDAKLATRREFTNALRQELPDALIALQHGNIAPVDLAQAAIGPGMAIYSRYAKVLEADGTPMRVRAALQLINQELDAYLEAQEGELDPDTRFCIAWYDQHGYRAAPFGEADVLARAKGTAVDGLRRAGVVEAGGGKVRLLRREEFAADWDPREDRRVPVWECAQQVIRRFETEGQVAAGALLAVLGPELAESARALAYRLFTLCERRGRADEALSYNGLVTAWSDIQGAADQATAGLPVQGRLDV